MRFPFVTKKPGVPGNWRDVMNRPESRVVGSQVEDPKFG
jgi:hypothetical protein